MTTNTGLFGKTLWPGVNAWYGKAYNQFETEFDKVFKTYKSSKAYEEDVSVSTFGLAQQTGEGQAVPYDTEQQGFLDRYTHATFQLGMKITKEMFEDDQYDIVGERKASGIALSMRQTKEVVGWNIFNRAFNTAYTYGDGKALIVADHPKIAGGTWSNVIATAADISETALEQAFIDIQKYTDDRGKKINVKPQKIVVPVDLDFDLAKIMQTQYEVGTNNNTVNVVRSRFPGGTMVSHWLTDPDAWFIITNVDHGLKHFDRVPTKFTSDDDFDTDIAKYKARMRFSFGVSDKMCIYGSPGA